MKYFFLIIINLNIWACETCIEAKSPKLEFIASSSVEFDKLMKDSMHLMDTKMNEVQSNKNVDVYFLEMMIEHHQGAINMANSLLVHSKDEVMKNYARSIISAQSNEILFMKTQLKKIKKL